MGSMSSGEFRPSHSQSMAKIFDADGPVASEAFERAIGGLA
jgi:hypothetical protein